jgi:hypothetical protein
MAFPLSHSLRPHILYYEMSPVPRSTVMVLFITESISNIVLLSFGVACLAMVYVLLKSPAFRARRAGAGAKLPPGPEQHFLFGNLFNFPRSRWYEAFNEWQKLYGERLFGSLTLPLSTYSIHHLPPLFYHMQEISSMSI